MPSIVLPGGGGQHVVVTKLTALDIIRRAMEKINVWAAGETPNTAEANTALQELNFMLDNWASRQMYAFANQFQLFTLIPGKLPMTIGTADQSPDFVVTVQRPILLQNAALSLPGSPSNFDLPLNLRDDDWWANERVKNIETNVPTDLYYSADWPNGSLYFWPVPNTAYQCRLEFLTAIAQIPSLTTEFFMPPGYADAVSLSLAEYVGTRFPGSMLTPQLSQQAAAARRTIQMLNNKAGRIQTMDSGMPDKARPKNTFNWMTGNLA